MVQGWGRNIPKDPQATQNRTLKLVLSLTGQ